jgi:crossover junction endodeoxyribonuclease RuvC
MAAKQVRVLGVDTSLRSTGLGLVECEGNRMSALEFGNIRVSPKAPVSEALSRISASVQRVIDSYKPDAVAIEGIFYCRNVRTAVKLGEARGVVISACADRETPVFEYAPRKVKQAVVGYGSAGKEQVRSMLMRILGMREEPQEDAGDALAIAICHLHTLSSAMFTGAKPV